MSGPAIGRAALEAEEAEKTQEVARLAQTVEALEARLEQEKTALAHAVGGLTTLRKVLGTPVTGVPAPAPVANGDRPKRTRKKK